jgi:hypothetical protein
MLDLKTKTRPFMIYFTGLAYIYYFCQIFGPGLALQLGVRSLF